jgi:hypothetical protein
MTMRETLDEMDEEELRSLKAGSMPAAYDDPKAPEMPLPDDGVNELPEMDFSDSGPFGAPDDSSSELKYLSRQPTGDATPSVPKPVAPSPAQDANDEYAAALRKIRDHLAKPAPDMADGYMKARQQDAEENRTNRIMDLLNAGLRRAPTPNASPLATNAAGFLQKSQLERAQSDGELARLGKVAQLARPMKAGGAGKDPGDVEKVRAYLVKVGAGSPEELAGMNEKQLGAVMTAYGLKVRGDESANDNKRADAQFEETKRHNRESEGAAWRAANNRPVPASEGGAIGEVGAAATALDELYAAHRAGGFGGMLSKAGAVMTDKLGLNNQTAQYQDQMKATAQVVGRILEEGKMTDADLPRYLSMMPQPGDDDARASKKVAFINHLLALKRDGKVEALAALGFNVKGVQGKGGRSVNVRFPNGKVVPVPEAEVDEATSKFGGEVVQ